MSERSRTTSQMKQQILDKLQFNFQKIDPSFQVKYFISENSALFEKHVNQWNRNDRIRTVHEQQISKVIKTLKHPFTLLSYNEKPFFTSIQKKEIKQNSCQEVNQIKPKQKSVQNNPLKKLLLQHSNLSNLLYEGYSDDMKKIIDFYQTEEQNTKQRANKSVLTTPRPKTMYKTERENFTITYTQFPQSPVSPERKGLIFKHNNLVSQLDQLQQDLVSSKRSIFQLSKIKYRMGKNNKAEFFK